MSETGRPVLLGYVGQRFTSVFGEKRVVFLAILAVARMEIWTMQKKGLYDGANVSHWDLILFFRHQLRVKIRCDRKRLNCITFDRRWLHAVSMFVQRGNVGVILPSSSSAWRWRTGSFRTPLLVSRIACFPFSLVSSMLKVIVSVI